jgi:hypothetical protein
VVWVEGSCASPSTKGILERKKTAVLFCMFILKQRRKIFFFLLEMGNGNRGEKIQKKHS